MMADRLTQCAVENLREGNMANLELQLAEIDMLSSMYPCEFRLEDNESVGRIQEFVEGRISYECLHHRIGFIVTLDAKQGEIEVVCRLPHEYPGTCHPDIFSRLPSAYTRESQKALTDRLYEFIDSLTLGDVCIGPIIAWIQDNVGKYLKETEDGGKAQALEEKLTFVRLWLYSHHIYSKFKRRDIIDIAGELKLCGFSVPGKPGLICVEGLDRDVDQFWNTIRRMSWKKLAIKDREEIVVNSTLELQQCSKFGAFEEKAFDMRGGKGREYHMDLGKVFEFLDGAGCGHVFSYYFGLEGRISNKLTDT